MVKKDVCVKWIQDKCVKWETNSDGGVNLNLKKCPVKLANQIEGQLRKGLKVERVLKEE